MNTIKRNKKNAVTEPVSEYQEDLLLKQTAATKLTKGGYIRDF